MKQSYYNVVVYNEKKQIYIIFNTCTSEHLQMLPAEYEKFAGIGHSEKLDNVDEESIKKWIRKGFIIENEKDEIKELMYKSYISKFYCDTLRLTITSTHRCNFACSYCYENVKDKVDMTHQTQYKVKNFVIQTLNSKKPKIKTIKITWYGGEPLLAIDVILSLSTTLIEIAREYGCDYKASMVTNGSLLTETNFEQLFKYNITSYQITIDGMPQIHNVRRPLKTANGPTFEKIVKNIEHIIDKCNIIIRVNIDKNNISSLHELLYFFTKRGWLAHKNFDVYLDMVSLSDNESNETQKKCLMSNTRFSNVMLGFLKTKMEVTKRIELPGGRFHGCAAVTENSYVIDANGDIFQCWEYIGMKSKKVGSVFNGIDRDKLSKWLSINIFSNQKCKKCKILPICMGGCPLHYYSRNDKKSPPFCSPWYYMIDDFLKLIPDFENIE